MAKHLKIKIKNTQIAKAVDLGGIKDKLKKKSEPKPKKKTEKTSEDPKAEAKKEELKEAPKKLVRARKKSAFAEGENEKDESETVVEEIQETPPATSEETVSTEKEPEPTFEEPKAEAVETETPEKVEEEPKKEVAKEKVVQKPKPGPLKLLKSPRKSYTAPPITPAASPKEQLGPTGKHVRDLVTPKPAKKPQEKSESKEERSKPKPKKEPHAATAPSNDTQSRQTKGKGKAGKTIEFHDLKPKRKDQPAFDSRDRQGLRNRDDENQGYRKRRGKPQKIKHEVPVVRPSSLKVRLPITLKDLAAEMKYKASELIQKLFMQGIVVTINDYLDDETTVQLLGHEFGCEIEIDTAEEERIRITDKSVSEEVAETEPEKLKTRPPVIAFMGHVDHGKTSLIDTIRKSNRASGEAGAITQHIGAFQCHTPVGDITVLDTPGHEAFSAMRARGADVTDIVVLVVAGDEGIRAQTIEAIQHAKAAGVTLVVAVNKCDKPNFNPETVYRQLSEQELLPEEWGGTTITVNCSAVTGEGVDQLLEMLALQAEVLELKADESARARGRVLESELHKGMGITTTLLVQNGTLRTGDALVFDQFWGRIKTMRNDLGKHVDSAGPSAAVEVTGLSGLPEAGQEFIVVGSERDAREIAEARMEEFRETRMKQKRMSMENIFQEAAEGEKKILNVILRADVQGSLEALKNALERIESDKAELNIIFLGVGEISESDIQLAMASKAIVLGFHVQVESHADLLIKESGVQIRTHDVIYHAIDDIKQLMTGLLDKIAEERDCGKAQVLTTFKSSQYGVIAGCIITEGTISRNHKVRIFRGKEQIWKGGLASLRRVKEDVKEVTKGIECGILLEGTRDVQEGDVIQSYEVIYKEQQL